MREGRHGKVIQGFFVGAPRRPAAPFGVAPHRAPPLPCACAHPTPGRQAMVQAKPLAGPPPLAAGRSPVVQAHGADQSFQIDPVQIGLARSGGAPLPQALLAKMEAALGADFSSVRIHIGPQPARIGALAFTTGEQLYFAPGQYQPDSPQGQRLIGHELTHVIQQRQGRVPAPGGGVAVVQNRLLEAEADRLGARAAAWRAPAMPSAGRATPPYPTRGTPLQRMTAPRTDKTLFTVHKDSRRVIDQPVTLGATQSDLSSVVTSQGTGLFKVEGFDFEPYVSSNAGSGVIAYIKVNGKIISIGTNNNTERHHEFDAGIYKQGTNPHDPNEMVTKDNFHAEDWVIKGFKEEYKAAANKQKNKGIYRLSDWLDTLGHHKSDNASQNLGAPGKHFISLSVSACPCQGCSVSLRAFKAYLDRELGANMFVFRIKFLRTYNLNYRTKTGKTVDEFTSTIAALLQDDIFVRMQPERSATKILKSTDDTRTLSEDVAQEFAVNHPTIRHALTNDQKNYLIKSWSQLGVSRMGTNRAGEALNPLKLRAPVRRAPVTPGLQIGTPTTMPTGAPQPPMPSGASTPQISWNFVDVSQSTRPYKTPPKGPQGRIDPYKK